MFYCFRCGGRLPESTRAELFLKPEAAEQAEATSLLATAKSLADVFRLLGPADEVFSWDDVQIDRVHPKTVQWKRLLRYSKRWKTFTLDVMEMPDGSLGGTMIAGKLRE
jgi:hypothetical protein